MLRCARVKNQLTLEMPRQEGLFSSPLLKGFALSLAFHLGFLLLFHVVSPNPPDDCCSLLPSSVEIDLGEASSSTATISYSPFEGRLAPPLYELTRSATCSLEHYREFDCAEPDFSAIEALEYQPLDVDFDSY